MSTVPSSVSVFTGPDGRTYAGDKLPVAVVMYENKLGGQIIAKKRSRASASVPAPALAQNPDHGVRFRLPATATKDKTHAWA